MKDQSIIKVNKLFYKLSSLTSLTSITMMNDILTKQALKISLVVDEGETNKREAKSERDQFLILCFTVGGEMASISGTASTMFSISCGDVLPTIVTSASFPSIYYETPSFIYGLHLSGYMRSQRRKKKKSTGVTWTSQALMVKDLV